MTVQFIEVIAGDTIRNGDLIFIRDGKAYPSWDVRLTRLLERHQIEAVRRNGAIEIVHEGFGVVTILDDDARRVYETVVTCLRASGIEP